MKRRSIYQSRREAESGIIQQSTWLCIEGYRRYISPHKGYRCAYHAATGRRSCSRFAQQAIRKCGVWNGARLLRRRFERCALAAAAFADSSANPKQDKFFGQCDPAVQEFRKLYCRGCLGGFLESLGD
jgi:putative component of membrane protein insertase Oxa1/YidC/SpoIIIJ protein YidD